MTRPVNFYPGSDVGRMWSDLLMQAKSMGRDIDALRLLRGEHAVIDAPLSRVAADCCNQVADILASTADIAGARAARDLAAQFQSRTSRN